MPAATQHPCRQRPNRRSHPRSERGAVLVHVAIAFIGLTAFGSFVVDYGVLWTARRQAQNAADAGAMAAAAALGFGDFGDFGRAQAAALEAARANFVWGEVPDVTAADVYHVSCPAGSLQPGEATTCVRVDVFRNQRPGGNPLPTILGGLVGIANQGVRATATAEVHFSNTASCVKPLAILDRWNEAGSPPWEPNGDTFDRYAPPPSPPGTLLPSPDSYVGATPGNNGSGLDLTENYGQPLQLARWNSTFPDSTSWYFPVELDCAGNTPGSIECFTWTVRNCSPQVVSPGIIPAHVGGFIDASGVNQLIPALADLVATDPSAAWDDAANGGRGGIVGGCMASGDCSVSPRLIAVPAVDPDAWSLQGTYSTPPGEHTNVNVTRIVGLFIEGVNGLVIDGRIMPYPVTPSATDAAVPGSAFVVSTLLVR